MNRIAAIFLMPALAALSVSCANNDTQAPRVVSTFPENGAVDIDPALSEMSVVFNEKMADQSWSWVYENKNTFPIMTGQAYYTDDQTKNILPVKLEANKEYVVWINQPEFRNFKDKSGNPAVPFRFSFKTGPVTN